MTPLPKYHHDDDTTRTTMYSSSPTTTATVMCIDQNHHHGGADKNSSIGIKIAHVTDDSSTSISSSYKTDDGTHDDDVNSDGYSSRIKPNTSSDSLHNDNDIGVGSSSSSNNSSSGKLSGRKLKPSVSFHTISVREFGIELGDNPAVTAGPPLTIGWDYEDVGTVGVEDYEESRGTRRFKEEMQIPPKRREAILLQETDNTPQQIAAVMTSVRRSRSQRQHTVALMDFEHWHELFETIGRRFRRFRSGVSKQREQELLWEGAQKHKQHEQNQASAPPR
jgi:hypothetical protein